MLHPLSSSAGGAIATQVLLGTSQTYPRAQSSLDTHAVLHAPNAGSQRYGPHSNGTASSVEHAPPGAEQNAGPTPLEGPVQRLRAHIVPLPAPMHCAPGPHVPTHASAAPHSLLRSTPVGSGVHLPGLVSSAQE